MRGRESRFPESWECRHLPDGRVAYLEKFGDGWHVVIDDSTVAVVDDKKAALDVIQQQRH